MHRPLLVCGVIFTGSSSRMLHMHRSLLCCNVGHVQDRATCGSYMPLSIGSCSHNGKVRMVRTESCNDLERS